MTNICHKLMLAFSFLFICQSAEAGVIVGATRVIYDGDRKEASVSVINPEKSTPYLIQSWVEKSESSTETPPFIITPPLFRLDSGQENILRIVRTGGQLPDDRESLYWLSIKSIPSTDKEVKNQLLISVKTRIKLIFRPASLKNLASEAYKKLIFSRQKNRLQVYNPTPFYIAFYSVKVGGTEISDAGTVGPQSLMTWPLATGSDNHVRWQTINDFGGISPAESSMLRVE